MHNKFAGDVGDFWEIGILRRLSSSNLKVGVNY